MRRQRIGTGTLLAIALGLSGSAIDAISLAVQVSAPAGSPRIGFTPIGTPFGSSAAYSYLAGRPVVRLPNGLTIDPYNTGVGITLHDPNQLAAMQQRYQIQNAQATEAYQQSMAMQQEQGGSPKRDASAIRQAYDPRSGRARRSAESSRAKQAETPLFDASGQLVWPDFAPKNALREEVDRAIARVRDEVQSTGTATVANAVQAKQALHRYGVPALRGVPGGSKVLAERLRGHLHRLDTELDRLVEAQPEKNPSEK
ncbi:MAG: hypothetical protein SFX72_13715 [Isosphaeraceae bacterium]|nr:hypothetical protein [Isosphaeraceae bacterium]